MSITLYNSLSKRPEELSTIEDGLVRLYTCGMTVYDYAHIGHGRKYVMDDILKRTLVFNGYKVKHVQNVTDVGHMVSDADEGQDKLEKGSEKYGKDVWSLAKYFMDNFYSSMDKLNIIRPDVVCRATDNIEEQIFLIQKIFNKGVAYDTPEAVYFNTAMFDGYGDLFGQKLDQKKTAVRDEVHVDPNKKNPADFVLWFKKVGKYQNHIMHWPSPWGEGFPGWHIECSAMSIKYLGERIDIHTGGEDHLSVHHPNEIAQSETATGQSPFSRFWIHYAFLMVDGKKMSKSLGNYYTIEDITKKGYDPISLRYLYLSTHYKKPMNFTWQSLDSAQNGLFNLRKQVLQLKNSSRTVLSDEKNQKIDDFRKNFSDSMNQDLNTSKALAVLFSVLKSNIPSEDKYDLIKSFDEVLGLGL